MVLAGRSNLHDIEDTEGTYSSTYMCTRVGKLNFQIFFILILFSFLFRWSKGKDTYVGFYKSIFF